MHKSMHGGGGDVFFRSSVIFVLFRGKDSMHVCACMHTYAAW